MCIMFGIGNKNYVIRPDSNHIWINKTWRYVTGQCPRFVRGGGKNMFPCFRRYVLCVEAYLIYLGIMSHFLYLKIDSKIDCVCRDIWLFLILLLYPICRDIWLFLILLSYPICRDIWLFLILLLYPIYFNFYFLERIDFNNCVDWLPHQIMSNTMLVFSHTYPISIWLILWP